MRVVLDTNVLVSAALKRPQGRLRLGLVLLHVLLPEAASAPAADLI
jgi:predicted nucleic acid-binding protein